MFMDDKNCKVIIVGASASMKAKIANLIHAFEELDLITAEAQNPSGILKITNPVARNTSPMELHPNDDWRRKSKRKFR